MIWYLSIVAKNCSPIIFHSNRLEPRPGSEQKLIFEGSYSLNCGAVVLHVLISTDAGTEVLFLPQGVMAPDVYLLGQLVYLYIVLIGIGNHIKYMVVTWFRYQYKNLETIYYSL